MGTENPLEAMNIHPDVLDDPELQDLAKQAIPDVEEGVQDQEQNQEHTEEESTNEATVESDSEGASDSGSEEAGDESDDMKGEEKTVEETSDSMDDQDAEAVIEFEQDVAIGDVVIDKDTLAKTPVPVLEQLAKVKQLVEEKTNELNLAATEKKKLLDDPVVKDRLKAIQEGRALESYSQYSMSSDSASELSKVLNDLAIEGDDANKVMTAVRKAFEADVEDNVRRAANARLSQQRIDQAKSQSFELLRKLGDLNPSMKINETDAEKFLSMKDQHPEWSKVGPVFDYWAERVGTWSKFSELSPEEIYAAAAAKLGLPVAINTKGRDQKIAQGERERLLSILGGKKRAKSVGANKSPKTTPKNVSVDDDGAISKDKLDDTEYQSRLLDSATESEDLFEVQKQIKEALGV